jgi:acyl-CoA synthetase (AMP-forming)/AMP-acid ligase II
MYLLDSIKKNKSLRFIDAESNKSLSINDLNTNFFDIKEKKQLFFLYLDNSLEAIDMLFNGLDSPHALVLLNPKLNIIFKEELEKAYLPTYIFDDTRPTIESYATTSFIGNRTIFKSKNIRETAIHTDLKIMLSTSGTTGSPKFVKLSEANLAANAQSISKYLPISEDDVTPLNLSIFYSYGLSILTSNALKGGTIVCTNKDIMNKDFWSDFEKWGYTTMAGVPYVYEMLNRIGFLKKEYPSLRYMTQAGGKLNSKLVEAFGVHLKNQGKDFYVMYGQTEATARMSYLPPAKLEEKLGSIGIAIPNGSFMIDEATSELLYQGPNVFGGYATTLADLTTFEKVDTLRTGDLAAIDDDGFYYITGRLKRFAKIFGTRTNLDEVETILKNEFVGNIFIALGKDDEKLIICVTNEETEDIAIKNFLKDKMQIHPSVVKIVKLEQIPLTANGKTDYKAIETNL